MLTSMAITWKRKNKKSLSTQKKSVFFLPQTSLQAKLTSSASHSKLSAGTLRSSDGLGNETWKKKVTPGPGDTPFKGSMAFLYLFML